MLYGPRPDVTRDNSLCYGRPEGDVDGLAANNMTVLSLTDRAELLYGPCRISEKKLQPDGVGQINVPLASKEAGDKNKKIKKKT